MEGFESVIAIDIWDDAIKTYNHNRKKKVGVSTDITQFNNDILPEILQDYKIDGIVGGPHHVKVLVLLDYQTQQIKLVKSIKVEIIYILSFLELLTL